MKIENTIGFKRVKEQKNKGAENKEPELERKEEVEMDELNSGYLESIMDGEQYHFENALDGNLKKMKYLLLTQFPEAPLSIKTKMLNDYNTALISAFILKNDKQ